MMILNGPDGLPGGLLTDTERRDQIFASAREDTIVLSRDGKTDIIHDFTVGEDQIDLTAFNVLFDALKIFQTEPGRFVVRVRDERIVVTMADPGGDAPAWTPDLLAEDSFVFDPGAAPQPARTLTDTAGFDRFTGTNLPDTYVLTPDGVRDAIRNFELDKDLVDIAAFNTSFADLTFIDRKPGRVVVQVPTGSGTEEVVLHDTAKLFTSANIDADNFVF